MLQIWLLWAALAFVSFGAWAVLSKAAGDTLSASHLQALSTIGMLPVIAALVFLKRPPDPGNRRRGILVALAGGAVSCLGNIPYFQALATKDAKAVAVVSLAALYPLVTVLLAVGFLRERLSRVQVLGIALSLVGAYFLNVPGEQNLVSNWLPQALAAAVLWGIAGLFQKVSTFDVSGNQSSIWFLTAFVPLGLGILINEPLPTKPSLSLWGLAAAIGFALAFGNYAVIVAYETGKASIITPIVSLYPVISIAAAIVLFGERIGWREALGISFALVSIVALSYEPPARTPAPVSQGSDAP